MASLTDPARELSEVSSRLQITSSAAGDQFLANAFGVKVWSTDFVKIIACVLERADLVADIISRQGMDSDHLSNALAHIKRFQEGFTGSALRKPWEAPSFGYSIMRDHGGPIQFLSQTVRPVVSYPRLSETEIAEMLSLIDEYLVELSASDEGPDFVRQSILEGLSRFRFQLDKIGWMGSGYALAAFREALFIYERSRQYGWASNPDASAVLSGFLTILKTFKKKVDQASDWKDSAETVFDAYKLATSVVAPALLTSQYLLPGR